jgi:leader peptidase (prepilin peptidase)/N-methyltransferase
MTNPWTFVCALLGGVAGWGAGRLGRGLLGSIRRGVRPPPLCCEIPVAGLWVAVAARSAGSLPWWWVPVPLLLGWFAVLLALCDLLALRLPDALTLPAYPVAALLLCWAAYWSRAPDLLVGALLGTGLFAGTYAVVRLVFRTAMGPGDVKLAGSLGAVVGAVSVPAVLLCMIVAALLTLVLSLRATEGGVPHGPAMLFPAWLITAVSPVPVWGGPSG